MANDLYEKGMRIRRMLFGDDYVDNAEAGKTDFDAAFQTLIAEGPWGSVWASDAITPRERSMITIALLAAVGHYAELAMHVRATRNTGATLTDIREALLHVAIYAGVPAANRAFATAKQALSELGMIES